MTIVLVVLAIILALDGGMLLMLWRHQERIVFQPPSVLEPASDDVLRLEYSSRDGIDLVAYVVEAAEARAPVVLAFHGNAIIARWLIPWARELSRRFGVTVVLPEYRGYDGLGGMPSYAGVAQDAEAALDAVCGSYAVRAPDVTFYGHSLGTAIAVELAAKSLPKALVLESPFSSARDMAARWPVIGLGLLWQRISRVHYETATRVASMDIAVHVAHGERDLIVPARMGRAVHAAALRPGNLLIVPDAGHNDLASVGGEKYWEWIGGRVE
jgi:fermentation-respiration switch protein FrsA (DUF1100 family)